MDIRDLRQRLGLTQAQLADLVGTHAMTVSKWERGVLRPQEHARRLMTAFEQAIDRNPALAQRGGDHDPVRFLAELLRLAQRGPEVDLGALSATNRFAGTVVQLARGDVMSKVVIEIAPDVRIGSVITTDSVDRLGLEPGSPAIAIIKATEVIVGRP